MAKAKKTKKQEDDILDQINAEFGEGTLISMTEPPPHQYEAISTGSLNLDAVLGIGGLPRGRIVEIYGPESSGKTTIALQTVASAMRAGHRCAFIDAEHALDVTYAQALGVDLSKLMVSQPDHGEQALEVCERLVRSEACAVVVVDSVAALTPLAELEGSMSDTQVGLQARMMSKALRKLVAAVHVSDTLLIFINQTRSKIGGYGNPETTSGGNALKFYASIRIRIVRTGANKAGGVAVSAPTKAKVVKNKCAPPFGEAEFDIEFGTGVSLAGEVFDHAVTKGLILKAGAWYSLADGTRLAQGREKAKQCLVEQPEVMQTLLEKVTAR
jgi:recombination protein RecA